MDTDTGLAALVEDAAEAVRAAGHHRGDDTTIADLYRLAGALDTLVARTASICDLAAAKSQHLARTRHFRHDANGDPTATITAAVAALELTAGRLRQLAGPLGGAHNALGHIIQLPDPSTGDPQLR